MRSDKYNGCVPILVHILRFNPSWYIYITSIKANYTDSQLALTVTTRLNFQVSRWNIYFFWFIINLAYTKSIIYFFMRHFPIWNWINKSSKCKNLYVSQRGIRTPGCPNNTYFCYRERLFVLTGHLSCSQGFRMGW